VRYPNEGCGEGEGGVGGEDGDCRVGCQQPTRAVHGDGSLHGGGGQVLTQAGRQELTEDDVPDDDQR
jgi:hypothetical protein